MNSNIDTTHPVFDAFRAAGYEPEALLDPGEVTVDAAESGDLRLIRWTNSGIEMFDVFEDDVTTEGHGSEHGVRFGSHGSIQPIDFDGFLYEELGSMTRLKSGPSTAVSFFARREDRQVPEMEAAFALQALRLWGSEGYVPKDTAEAMLRAVGGDPDATSPREDPDVQGLQIVRAPYVAEMMASTSDGVDAKTPDRDVNGHKKRRRQNFYRNLEALESAFGVEVEV